MKKRGFDWFCKVAAFLFYFLQKETSWCPNLCLNAACMFIFYYFFVLNGQQLYRCFTAAAALAHLMRSCRECVFLLFSLLLLLFCVCVCACVHASHEAPPCLLPTSRVSNLEQTHNTHSSRYPLVTGQQMKYASAWFVLNLMFYCFFLLYFF